MKKQNIDSSVVYTAPTKEWLLEKSLGLPIWLRFLSDTEDNDKAEFMIVALGKYDVNICGTNGISSWTYERLYKIGTQFRYGNGPWQLFLREARSW